MVPSITPTLPTTTKGVHPLFGHQNQAQKLMVWPEQMAGICGPVGNSGTGCLKQEVWEFYCERDQKWAANCNDIAVKQPYK